MVLYHLDPSWLPRGYLGVDVFFVISGFVVSYSVAGRGRMNFWRFLIDFYRRRIIRIYPALIVCLLATILASALFIPDAYLNQSMYEVAKYAFFGLSNLQLAAGTDYFSPLAEFNPFTHTWSLAVEEQFYFLFPVLFFTYVASSHRRDVVMLLFAAALGASVCAWGFIQSTDQSSAFYLVQARFWQLASGVLMFLLIDAGYRNKGRWLGQVVAAFGLIVLLASFAVTPPVGYGWASNVAAVVGTLCILWACSGSEMLAGRLLSIKPLVFIGLISYSLYLWHWPVIILARWTFGAETLASKAVIALAFSVFAVGSYYLVEQPFRHLHRAKWLPPSAIVAGGLAVIVGAWFGGAALADNRATLSLSTVMQHSSAWHQGGPNTDPSVPGCALQESYRSGRWDFDRTGCEVNPDWARIFVVGDSHAGAYLPLLKSVTLRTGLPTTIASYAGCPYLSLMAARDANCAASNAAGLAELKAQLRAGDVLLLASLRMPRLADQWSRPDAAAEARILAEFLGDQSRPQAVGYAVAELAPLVAMGVRVVFEAPKPLFYSPTFRCADWFNRINPICEGGPTVSRAQIEARRAPVLVAMGQVIDQLPQVQIWDPLPTLCDATECRSMDAEGNPIFFDGDHLSAFGNGMLYEDFARQIAGITPSR